MKAFDKSQESKSLKTQQEQETKETAKGFG